MTRNQEEFKKGFIRRVAGQDAEQKGFHYMRGFNMAKYLDPRPEHRGRKAVWS